MSNGNSQNASIWPVVTVIVGVLALAAVGWDVMLQGRIKKLEERFAQVEVRARGAAPVKAPPKVAAEAPAPPRRRGKGAATRPATTQSATVPSETSGEQPK